MTTELHVQIARLTAERDAARTCLAAILDVLEHGADFQLGPQGRHSGLVARIKRVLTPSPDVR